MRKSRKRLKVGKTIHIYGVDILTLHEKKCIPCEGGIPPLTVEQIKPYMEQIHQEWKLVLDPEIEFPEAYMRNEIEIKNGSLEEFLMSLVKNLGREEITTASYLSKKLFEIARFVSNFNLPVKSGS